MLIANLVDLDAIRVYRIRIIAYNVSQGQEEHFNFLHVGVSRGISKLIIKLIAKDAHFNVYLVKIQLIIALNVKQEQEEIWLPPAIATKVFTKFQNNQTVEIVILIVFPVQILLIIAHSVKLDKGEIQYFLIVVVKMGIMKIVQRRIQTVCSVNFDAKAALYQRKIVMNVSQVLVGRWSFLLVGVRWDILKLVNKMTVNCVVLNAILV